MKTVIRGKSFLFGIVNPPPVLPGFKIVASAKEFLQAVQGNHRFFVEKRGNGFRLWPIKDNPRRHVRNDCVLFVPAPVDGSTP
jgi:hypothetical protein